MKDITNIVAKCSTCAKFRRQNQKQPMISHDVPDQPWTKLASDIMTFRGHDYLVVVDYTSKYPEVVRTSQTAEGVITALKLILARHGIPQEIVSDNMPVT